MDTMNLAARPTRYAEDYSSGPELRPERIHACGPHGITASVNARRAAHFGCVSRSSQWLADPLALDVAFQLGIVWSQEQLGMPALPTHVRSYRQYRRSFHARSACRGRCDTATSTGW